MRNVLLFCCLLIAASGARAGTLELPLRVPFAPVRDALAAQMATSSDKPTVIYEEGPCNYLHLEKPQLEARDGRLRFAGPGAAALGVELFDACQNAAQWQGTMEFILAPQLDSTGHLRLHIVDSRLTDASGKPAPTVGFIWDLVKRFAHPRLEQFSYDVGASRDALLTLLKSVAPPEHLSELEQALAQLQIREPHVDARDIVVPIAFPVPDAWQTPPPATPAAPLTPEELDKLEQTLQPWDAFVVYSIKQLARDIPDRAIRARLFDLLLDSRYRLVAILSGETAEPGDPLRALFIETWNELRAILEDAQQRGLLDALLLRYITYVNAGDALIALDRAAPGLGMRITADALRQLARSLRPEDLADPLAYDWKVDPQLRELFEFEELPEDKPPPAAPDHSLLEFLITPAHATESRPLDRWVPDDNELDAYRQRIAELLASTADSALRGDTVDATYEQIFRNLVPTTALIESCWRQYVRKPGEVTYLRSAAGSVGLMQINQLVWRGFYDVERLRWDTAYNARAGAQILMRYLERYAIPYAERHGNPDFAPRAVYCVYNAGPRAIGRFRAARSAKREQYVDKRLWTLYQGIAAGGRVNLMQCRVDTP